MTKNLELKKKIIAAFNEINEFEYPSYRKIRALLSLQGVSVTEPTIRSYILKSNVKRNHQKIPSTPVNVDSVQAAALELSLSRISPTINAIRKELNGAQISTISKVRKTLIHGLIEKKSLTEILATPPTSIIVFENQALVYEFARVNILVAKSQTHEENEFSLALHAILMALQFEVPCALMLCESICNQAIHSAISALRLTPTQVEIINKNLTVMVMRDVKKLHLLYTLDDHIFRQIRLLYQNGCQHIFVQSFITKLYIQNHKKSESLITYALTAIYKMKHSMVSKDQTFTSSESLDLLHHKNSNDLYLKASILWYSPLVGTEYAQLI